MRTISILFALAILPGCGTRPNRTVEVSTAEPARGAEPSAAGDATCGLSAYPFPQSFEQALADAASPARKRTSSVQVQMAVDRNGRITHLRYLSLSTDDEVNRLAFDSLARQQFRPVTIHGEQVAACTTEMVRVEY